MGMPILAGRVFDDRVKPNDRTEVVVNEALAELGLPAADQVRRHLAGVNAAKDEPLSQRG